jgi:hypothetical protein
VPPTIHNSANLNPPPGEDDLATLGNFDERQQRRLGGHMRRRSPGPSCRFAPQTEISISWCRRLWHQGGRPGRWLLDFVVIQTFGHLRGSVFAAIASSSTSRSGKPIGPRK